MPNLFIYSKLFFKVLGYKLIPFGVKSFKPYKLTISINNKCNFKCSTCGIWRTKKPRELSTEAAYRLSRKYGSDLFFLSITGGEPFIDKEHLIRIVDIFLRNSPNLLKISINTNGFFEKNVEKTLKVLNKKYPKLGIHIGLSFIPNRSWGERRTAIVDAHEKMQKTLNILRRAKKSHFSKNNYYLIYTVNSKNDIKLLDGTQEDLWINFAEKGSFYRNKKYLKVGLLSKEEKYCIINDFYRKNKRRLSLLNKQYLVVLKKILSGDDRGTLKCFAGINRLYVDCGGGEFICTRGLKDFDQKQASLCDDCWTPCEAVFDLLQGQGAALIKIMLDEKLNKI